jgi:O-antigen biosynthesis protein WbqP
MGLAQVSAYDGIPMRKKAYWDGISTKISLLQDIKIVLKTLVYLTKKPPIY